MVPNHQTAVGRKEREKETARSVGVGKRVIAPLPYCVNLQALVGGEFSAVAVQQIKQAAVAELHGEAQVRRPQRRAVKRHHVGVVERGHHHQLVRELLHQRLVNLHIPIAHARAQA